MHSETMKIPLIAKKKRVARFFIFLQCFFFVITKSTQGQFGIWLNKKIE